MRWLTAHHPPKKEEALTLEVDFGGLTFKATGTAGYVAAAYGMFLQHMKDAQLAELAEAKGEGLPELPGFRGDKKVGLC